MSDIEVVAELFLRREAWSRELDAARGDVDRLKTDLEAKAVYIPVRARDEITSQVEAIINQLNAREVVIPVRYVSEDSLIGGPSGSPAFTSGTFGGSFTGPSIIPTSAPDAFSYSGAAASGAFQDQRGATIEQAERQAIAAEENLSASDLSPIIAPSQAGSPAAVVPSAPISQAEQSALTGVAAENAVNEARWAQRTANIEAMLGPDTAGPAAGSQWASAVGGPAVAGAAWASAAGSQTVGQFSGFTPVTGAMTEAEQAGRFGREFEQMEAGRSVPSLGDIESAAEGPAEEGEAAAATGGRGGSGMMHGLRLFAAAHLAIKGVEAAYGSYEEGVNLDRIANEQGEGDAVNVSQEKEAAAEIKKMRGGAGGLTGAGQDFLHYILPGGDAPSWLSSIAGIDPSSVPKILQASSYDSAKQEQDAQQSVKDQDRQIKAQRTEERMLIREKSVDASMKKESDDFGIAESQNGLEKHLAEIKKRTDAMDAVIDKAESEQIADAQKLKSESRGKSTVDFAGRAKEQADARRENVRLLGRVAEGEAIEADLQKDEREERAEDSRSRRARSTVLSMQASSKELEQEEMGDSLGARMTRASEQARRANEELDRQHDSGAITGKDYADAQGEIKRRQFDEEKMATRAESRRTMRFQDETNELSISSPYARSRQRIEDRAKESEAGDSAHKDMYESRKLAEEFNLDREHSAKLADMDDRTQEMNLRASGRTIEAERLAIANRMKEDLAANEGDPKMQQAIRERANAQTAELNKPTFHNESMRSIYDGAIKAALSGGMGGAQGQAIAGLPFDPNRPKDALAAGIPGADPGSSWVDAQGHHHQARNMPDPAKAALANKQEHQNDHGKQAKPDGRQADNGGKEIKEAADVIKSSFANAQMLLLAV